MFSSVSFASDDDDIGVLSGLLLVVITILRPIITIIIFIISFILGVVLGSSLSALNIESFIFNKNNFTSLNIFIGERPTAFTEETFESITKWFGILFVVAIVLELIVLIYIAIHTVIKTFKQDPRKDSEIKKMLKDFILGLVVLIGMAVFIVTIISLNNAIVQILAKLMGTDNYFDNITNTLFKDAINIFGTNMKEGLLSLILYIIISTMGIIFFFYYVKRLLKVSFLIIISPIVAVTFSIDRRKGGATKLMNWTKMFIFTVFAQSIHALIYIALIKVVITGIGTTTTAYIPSIVLMISGIKFIWDAENIIKKLFGIEIEEVSKSAGFLVGAITAMSNVGKTGKKIAEKAPELATKAKDFKKPELGSKKVDKKDTIKKPKDKPALGTSGVSGQKDTKPKIKTRLEAGMDKLDKFVDKHGDKIPFKGLASSVVKSATIKLRNTGAITFKRGLKKAGKKLAKGLVKASFASITSIASHASPGINMFEAGLGGYALANWGMDKYTEKKTERRHKGVGRKYEKNKEHLSRQLYANIERGINLGQGAEQLDDLEAIKKMMEDEGLDLDLETIESFSSIDGESESTISDKYVDAYVEYISNTSMQELENAYLQAREVVVEEYANETGATLNQAKRYVELLKQDLLTARDFNYDILTNAERNLLHKFRHIVAKEQMDEFNANVTEFNVTPNNKLTYKKEVVEGTKQMIRKKNKNSNNNK